MAFDGGVLVIELEKEGVKKLSKILNDDSAELNEEFLAIRWHYGDIYTKLKSMGFKEITLKTVEKAVESVEGQLRDQSIAEGWKIIAAGLDYHDIKADPTGIGDERGHE